MMKNRKYDTDKWAKNRSVKFQIGVIISLLMVIYAFNYETSPATYLYESEEFSEREIDQLVEVYVNTPTKTKKLEGSDQLPENIDIEEIPLEIIKPELVSNDISIDQNQEVATSKYVKETALRLPPPEEKEPLIEEIVSNKIVTFAEKMPVFSECKEQFENYQEQLECSTQLLMKIIHKNLTYPIVARENGIEATVVASFVVNKSGEITDIQIERERGLGFDESVLKAVSKIPDMNPGEQNKKQVSVRMFVPVKFKIVND